MKMPVIHLTEGNVQCRVPPILVGKRFSVISIGLCNFHCPYCYLGGGVPRKGARFPNSVWMDIREVEDFIVHETQKGNPIKISGGEPTLVMNATCKLIIFAKKCGAYVCVDTTGWNPTAADKLAYLADQIAIDIKGSKRYLDRVTGGVSQELSWQNVMKSIEIISKSPASLEIRTPVFRFTTLRDLIEISECIPENSYWIIRRFITYWVPYDKCGEAKYKGTGPAMKLYPEWLGEPEKAYVEKLFASLKVRRPRLTNKAVLLLESPRDSSGIHCQRT